MTSALMTFDRTITMRCMAGDHVMPSSLPIPHSEGGSGLKLKRALSNVKAWRYSYRVIGSRGLDE
jgi:hypothetical protein